MERYYDNDPDDEKEPYFNSNDDNDNEDEAIAYIDQQGIIEVMNMDLAQSELHYDLLNKAINIAENSWFWRFKSTSNKLDEIDKIYKRLLKLTEDPEGASDQI